MGQKGLFDPSRRVRATDPETSKAAAVSINDLPERQRLVFSLLQHHGGVGLTDDQLQREYTVLEWGPKQTESSLRTRRAELVKLGLVEDSGERGLSPTGRKAVIWRIKR